MSALYSKWVGCKVTYLVFSVWGKEGGMRALIVQLYWTLPNSWARILLCAKWHCLLPCV